MSALVPARATAADAGDLARFAAWIFEETFGFNYPRADLDAFLASSYHPAKIAREIADPGSWMDVVRDASGAIVAYAFSGPLSLPVEAPEPGAFELKRIYLAPPVQGSGLADLLLARCYGAAHAAGAPSLYLGVWSRNPRAQAFYRRRGFEDAGAYQFPVGSVLDDELILRLAPVPVPGSGPVPVSDPGEPPQHRQQTGG
jgi:ribosomal protein S18 acetylase RimI-like enzyme